LRDRWATFDCYGTLIDWEGGIIRTMTKLWPEADAQRLLARYHEVEPHIQEGSARPYRAVLTEALRRIANNEGLPLAAHESDALARSLPQWPPFGEVPGALRELRGRGWHLAILSNTDPDLLDASIGNLGVDIDLRITVAEARSYKPAPGHWEHFFATTGADHARHAHVAASLFHDVSPATALGLRCVWINRAGQVGGSAADDELPDLTALPARLDALVPP
jgi:2-haloacid dehalogenase